MMEKYIEKAKTLLEALPYIQQFSGKTLVIKYGGSAMEDETLKRSVATDIVLLKFVGINPVIVHGGGKEINEWLERLSIPSHFIDGQRVTTPAAMEVIEMVLTGRVNKSLVNLINQAGGKAVGLSGKDANLILAEPHPNRELGLVGNVKSINADIIKQLLVDGYIPVISTVGVDESGQVYNINADVVAGEIAIALKAEKLIALSNVDGILDKDKQLIKQVTASQIEAMISDGTISGGMIPKVQSLLGAIHSGVRNVHVISGENEHSILLELFTDYGVGTMIKATL